MSNAAVLIVSCNIEKGEQLNLSLNMLFELVPFKIKMKYMPAALYFEIFGLRTIILIYLAQQLKVT